MKLHYSVLLLASIVLASCGNDDDGLPEVVTRDVEEVKAENMEQIEEFLKTHYYELVDNPQNPNFQSITYKRITDSDTDKEPVMDSEFLQSKTVTQLGVDYNLYFLKLREGAESVRKPTFADSVLVTYSGFRLLENRFFDSSPNPIWFDLNRNIIGFYEVMDEFRGSTGVVENPDGTVTFDDNFGYGTVFIPSGIAYFSAPPPGSGIRAYEPIAFNIQLYKSIETDHDGDGVPSWMEDVNGNRRLGDDNTNGNNTPNFLDTDDDGDGIPTREEVNFDEEGNLILPLPDSNGNGTPDYLDPTFP